MSEQRFSPGGNANAPSQGLDIAASAPTDFEAFLSGIKGPIGTFAQNKGRGRMAEALARQFRANREGGMSPSAAFSQIMADPAFIEGFVRDPDFGKTVAEAAALARQPTTETLAGAVGQAQEAGFLDPQLAQRFNILGATDLKGAIERFATELLPTPLTQAQIASLEQDADFFDRRLAFDERKHLWDVKKFEIEQALAARPELDDIMKFQQAFRTEAHNYVVGLQSHERVMQLYDNERDKDGVVSDASANALVTAYGRQINPDISRMTGDLVEELAQTGVWTQRLIGVMRKYVHGDNLTASDIEDIKNSSVELAQLAWEGFDNVGNAFVNSADANFPRSNLSRDELRKRIVPEIISPKTREAIERRRQEKRRQNEREGAAATKGRRPPAAPEAPAAIPRLSTEDDVNALPKGARFLWLDGNVYVKD